MGQEDSTANTLSASDLAHALLHGCTFHDADWAEEAAVQLLVAHETWLHRPELRTHLNLGGIEGGALTAWLDWPGLAAAVEVSPASGSERAVLRLACHLGGVVPEQAGELWSVADILSSLDAVNSLLASRAIAVAALGPDVVGDLD